MRTKFLVAASLAMAIGLASCSKSSDETVPPPAKGDNVLIVKLPPNMTGRAIEDPTDGTTPTKLDDVTIFLMTGNSVERSVELLEEEIRGGTKRFEQVPAQVDRVIVVGNRVGEPILGLRTASEIRNYAYTAGSQHKQSELTGRTLMGEAIPDDMAPDPNPDGHSYKQADVSLRAITARLEIGAVVPGDGVESVELVAVYINNAYGNYPKANLNYYPEGDAVWNATVSGNDPGVNNGSKDPIGTITPVAYDPTQYMTLGDFSQVKPTPDSKVYAFHVFPGNIPHVIMLVKMELKENYYETDNDDNPLKYKYGWITFSKFNTGKPAPNDYVKAMEAHNIYKMGVGAKGIKIDAKDITEQPEKGPYDLGVYIEIAPWEVNEVTPEV